MLTSGASWRVSPQLHHFPDDSIATSGAVDNATATATKAAVSGRQHVVRGVDAAFTNAAVGKLLTIKDGTTVIWRGYVHSQREVTFPSGIAITIGNACSAELSASGTGGQNGSVNLHGTTS
jgi:hypothetical protein